MTIFKHSQQGQLALTPLPFYGFPDGLKPGQALARVSRAQVSDCLNRHDPQFGHWVGVDLLEPVLRKVTGRARPQALFGAGDYRKCDDGHALAGLVHPVQIALGNTAWNLGVCDHAGMRSMVVSAPAAEQGQTADIPGFPERFHPFIDILAGHAGLDFGDCLVVHGNRCFEHLTVFRGRFADEIATPDLAEIQAVAEYYRGRIELINLFIR